MQVRVRIEKISICVNGYAGARDGIVMR
jgi:hypothetical protein